MSITGLPGQGPVRVGIPVADLTAGLFAAMGIMVALLERETLRQGTGDRDLAAAGADLHAGFPGDALAHRRRSARRRPATIIRPRSRPACSRPPTATSTSRPPGRRCGRRFARRSAFRELDQAIRTTRPARRARRTAMPSTPLMEKETVKNTSAYWVDAFNKAGVPCGPIYSIDQTFADPQVKHLGIAKDVRTQSQKTIRLVGQPVRLSRTPSDDRGAAADARRAHRRDPGRVRLQQGRDRKIARGEDSLSLNARESETRHERDGQDRQGALAQGSRRRLRGVQQSGAAQRDVARHVGRDRPHHGGFRQGRLAALRGAHRRGREGLRVGRGHLALRRGALQRGSGRALQRAPPRRRASRSSPIRSPPSR